MTKWTEDYQEKEKMKPVIEQTIQIDSMKQSVVNESEVMSFSFKEKPQNNMGLLQQNLRNCLQIIDEEVMKEYVTKLEQLSIIKYDKNEISISDVQLFKII